MADFFTAPTITLPCAMGGETETWWHKDCEEDEITERKSMREGVDSSGERRPLCEKMGERKEEQGRGKGQGTMPGILSYVCAEHF